MSYLIIHTPLGFWFYFQTSKAKLFCGTKFDLYHKGWSAGVLGSWLRNNLHIIWDEQWCEKVMVKSTVEDKGQGLVLPSLRNTTIFSQAFVACFIFWRTKGGVSGVAVEYLALLTDEAGAVDETDQAMSWACSCHGRCCGVLGFSMTCPNSESLSSIFFRHLFLVKTNEAYSTTCVLCILHWEGEGLEMLFGDNYDGLQPLCLLREANMKEQAVVSACGVTLITVTLDAVERTETHEL